jgi:hypothetical protein
MTSQVIFADQALLKGPGDELGVRIDQDIPESFIEDCKARREAADAAPIHFDGFFHVGRVPDVLFLKWLREGYDARIEPVAETLKKLRAEHSVFALTKRRI